jgi:hypothetical protein
VHPVALILGAAEPPSLRIAGLYLALAALVGLQARCLLSLLPAGSPGAGSGAERGATLGATALLAAVEVSALALIDPEHTSARWQGAGALLAVVGLPLLGSLVALRAWLGPSAMRPREQFVEPPQSAPSRVAAALLGLGCAAVILHRFGRDVFAGAQASAAPLPRDERVARWLIEGDWVPTALLGGALGATALFGLSRGWKSAMRRAVGLLIVLAITASASVVERALPGALLVAADLRPGAAGERLMVAAVTSALLLAVFRRRAERRALVLAPLTWTPMLEVVRPLWILAPLALTFAFVPNASRRRAAWPFGLVALLALALALAGRA